MAIPAATAALGRNPTLPPGGLPGARVLVSGASGLPVSPVRVGVGLGRFLASDRARRGLYSTLGSKQGQWTADWTHGGGAEGHLGCVSSLPHRHPETGSAWGPSPSSPSTPPSQSRGAVWLPCGEGRAPVLAMRLESPGRTPQTFPTPAGLSRRIALTSFALSVLMRSSGWAGALACSRTPQTSWGVHLPLEGLGTHSSASEPALPWGLSPQHGGLGRVGALGPKVRAPLIWVAAVRGS